MRFPGQPSKEEIDGAIVAFAPVALRCSNVSRVDSEQRQQKAPPARPYSAIEMPARALAALPECACFPIRLPSPQLSNPAPQLTAHDRLDHPHSAFAVVEAIDPSERLAACSEEVVRILASDLFDGFQAIGRKARRDDRHPLDPTGRKRLDRFIRVRLQPFGSSEAGLKRHDQSIAWQAQPQPEQIRRP